MIVATCGSMLYNEIMEVRTMMDLIEKVNSPLFTGIKAEDLDKLATAAAADVCTPGNPRFVDKDIIQGLYEKVL